MGYKRSSAREDFEAWKTQVLKVVKKAEKNYSLKAGVSDYILTSALFLTHSRFENYAKDSIRWFIQEVNKKSVQSGSLPGKLRECQVLSLFPHPVFRRYYAEDNERAILDNLNTHFKTGDWSWCKNDHIGLIDYRAVIGDAGYPSSKNFSRLFYKVGINIFAELGKRLHIDAEKVLDDIGGVRSEMAHVGMPQSITASDIAGKIQKLSDLVAGVDRVLSRVLNAL
jgi:hypothetical protein